jgi:hypothetical protein
MSSQNHLTETQIGAIKNCTTVSTFRKSNSLKFELLFGEHYQQVEKNREDKNIAQNIDYLFLPGQILGFFYESSGIDFKKIHHAFIMRSCWPGEVGNVVPGIYPGAEILVKTLSSAGAIKLKFILQKLANNGVNLALLSPDKYRHLNDLLEAKLNTDYFVGEIIKQLEIF